MMKKKVRKRKKKMKMNDDKIYAIKISGIRHYRVVHQVGLIHRPALRNGW